MKLQENPSLLSTLESESENYNEEIRKEIPHTENEFCVRVKKVFSCGDLWNIQRQMRSTNLRRYL